MGSATALQLAKVGQKVIVLEKNSPGRHASGVNAGGLRRLNRHPAEIPLAVVAAIFKSLTEKSCQIIGEHPILEKALPKVTTAQGFQSL